ncbi:MAG: ATP-binding protein [Pseudoxanthomonas sp.]
MVIRANAAWEALASDGCGFERRLAQSANYLAAWQVAVAEGVAEARRFPHEFQTLLQRPAGDFQIDYACHLADERSWFTARAVKFHSRGAAYVLITHAPARAATNTTSGLPSGEAYASQVAACSKARFGVWQYDVASRSILWSGEMDDTLGMPESASTSLEQAIAGCAPEFRQRLGERVAACVAEGTPIDEEFDIIATQGQRVSVRCLGMPERSSTGNVTGVRGAFLDLSSHNPSDAQTARVAARLVRTLENVTDAFFALDVSMAFSYVNNQAEKLLRKPRSELLGRNIWDVFPAAVGTVFEQQYRHAEQTGEPVDFVASYEPLGLWLEVRAFPAEGELSVYFRDVTERRAAQLALERSEQSLRLAVRAAGLGTWSWDRQQGRISWSDECARMFGAAAEGSISYDDFLMLINQEERNHKDITFRNALEREQEFRVDLRARTPAGDTRWLSVLGRMFPSDQEHGGSMQGVAFDITDQKNAEGELRRLNERLESSVGRRTAELEKATLEAESANRAKSAFLASMSHEIRTPMNGVLGMVEVLAQSELGSRQSEALKTIHESANNLLHLIDDILDFSKIEAGRLEIEKQATSLETLADSVCQTLNAEALSKGVTVNLYISPALPSQVMADSLRLRQVFFNLLGNAIKFSGGRSQRGQVRFAIEPDPAEGHCIVVTVEDNGIGISEEHMSHLFQVFTQAEASTTRRFGGTGLGLAICKQLVDLMGGSILAESELGKGSTFRVRLPTEQTRAPDQPDPLRLDGTQYVVVDDPNYEARDIAAYLLHAGASVLRVRSVHDALAFHDPSRRQVLVYGSEIRARNNAAALASLASAEVYCRLVVVRGRRQKIRKLSDTLVILDAATLRRAALLRAAAIAAGANLEVAVEDHEPEEVRPRPAAKRVAATERMTTLPILIAEDDLTNQKVILHQLELLGYRAEVASDGEEALSRWSESRYSLLLTDLHMPHRDGFSLASEIRRLEAPGQRMPIVMLTANAIRAQHNAMHPDIDDYLIKPATLAALAQAIEVAIRMPGAAAEAAQLPAAASDGDGDGEGTILDLNVLRELVGNDTAVHAEVLDAYQRSLHQATFELQSCSLRGDIAAVAGVAHRVKSSSRAVGALEFGELCAELEKAALVANGSLAQDLIVLFLKDVDALLAEIEHLTGSH